MSVSRVSEVGETVVDVDVETARGNGRNTVLSAHTAGPPTRVLRTTLFGGTIVFLFLYNLMKIEHCA